MVYDEDQQNNLPGRISRTSVARVEKQSVSPGTDASLEHFDSNSLIGKTIFDEYLIKDVIGHGGMAVVYKAECLSNRKPVAVKTLKYADATLMQRFIREIEIHKNLNHPNVVEAIDFKTTSDGRAFFVMELLQGRSIEDLFATKVRFTKPQRIAGIVFAVCDALSSAHSQGIIHRDIKPGNIIISKQGDTEKVSVVDFGLAKLYEDLQRITKTGQVLGSPVYMSPEQCLGEDLDPRSDIYSLAIVLYEMVTGELPYDAMTPVAMMESHCNPSIHPKPVNQLVPNLPFAEHLNFVIRRAVETEIGDRYQTVEEFKQAFAAWCDCVKTGQDNGFFERPEYQKYLDEDSSSANESETNASTKNAKPSNEMAKPASSFRNHAARGFDSLPEGASSSDVLQDLNNRMQSAPKTSSKPIASELDSLVNKTREVEIQKIKSEMNVDEPDSEGSAKLKSYVMTALVFVVVVALFAGGTIFFCVWYYKL